MAASTIVWGLSSATILRVHNGILEVRVGNEWRPAHGPTIAAAWARFNGDRVSNQYLALLQQPCGCFEDAKGLRWIQGSNPPHTVQACTWCAPWGSKGTVYVFELADDVTKLSERRWTDREIMEYERLPALIKVTGDKEEVILWNGYALR